MTLTLTPNAEKVVADYLRAHPDVAAITGRIVEKTPNSMDTPWVRYTQLAKPAMGNHRSDHALSPYFQFDCYAGKDGGQPEASLLARTVRAALVELRGAIGGAVITGVEIRGDSRQPDTQLDSRERFVLSAVVHLHS